MSTSAPEVYTPAFRALAVLSHCGFAKRKRRLSVSSMAEELGMGGRPVAAGREWETGIGSRVLYRRRGYRELNELALSCAFSR